MSIIGYTKALHVSRIDFFAKYLEPILTFLVIIGLGIRGFGIRALFTERIYREQRGPPGQYKKKTCFKISFFKNVIMYWVETGAVELLFWERVN